MVPKGRDDVHVAVGVEYSVDGGATTRSVRVRREVILAAGALNTPRLLKLSGVGPATELRALNISVAVDLPGVGGCNGGKPESGYTYAEAGLVLDSDYPYTSGQRGETGDCDVSQAAVR